MQHNAGEVLYTMLLKTYSEAANVLDYFRVTNSSFFGSFFNLGLL